MNRRALAETASRVIHEGGNEDVSRVPGWPFFPEPDSMT